MSLSSFNSFYDTYENPEGIAVSGSLFARDYNRKLGLQSDAACEA